MGLKRWMNAQSFAVLRDGCNEVSQRNLVGVSKEADGTDGTGGRATARVGRVSPRPPDHRQTIAPLGPMLCL